MKFGGILREKVGRRREWNAKFNQGANGAQTCIKFFAALPVSLAVQVFGGSGPKKNDAPVEAKR